MVNKTRDILSLKSGDISLLCPGGYNSIALFKTSKGAVHKYSSSGDAVVKFYRRGLQKSKFDEILRWHKTDFNKFDILKSQRFQQSFDAGTYTDKFGKTYFYSVLEYIDGTTIQDFFDSKIHLDAQLGKSILVQLFRDIILPAWGCGLIFSDIQGRNLILRKSGMLAMLDTEQMRHAAAETLRGADVFKDPNIETRMGFHSGSGRCDRNGPLPRFIKNVLLAAFFPERKNPEIEETMVMSAVKREFFSDGGPAQSLSVACGTTEKNASAFKSVQDFLERILSECESMGRP